MDIDKVIALCEDASIKFPETLLLSCQWVASSDLDAAGNRVWLDDNPQVLYDTLLASHWPVEAVKRLCMLFTYAAKHLGVEPKDLVDGGALEFLFDAKSQRGRPETPPSESPRITHGPKDVEKIRTNPFADIAELLWAVKRSQEQPTLEIEKVLRFIDSELRECVKSGLELLGRRCHQCENCDPVHDFPQPECTYFRDHAIEYHFTERWNGYYFTGFEFDHPKHGKIRLRDFICLMQNGAIPGDGDVLLSMLVLDDAVASNQPDLVAKARVIFNNRLASMPPSAKLQPLRDETVVRVKSEATERYEQLVISAKETKSKASDGTQIVNPEADCHGLVEQPASAENLEAEDWDFPVSHSDYVPLSDAANSLGMDRNDLRKELLKRGLASPCGKKAIAYKKAPQLRAQKFDDQWWVVTEDIQNRESFRGHMPNG